MLRLEVLRKAKCDSTSNVSSITRKHDLSWAQIVLFRAARTAGESTITDEYSQGSSDEHYEEFSHNKLPTVSLMEETVGRGDAYISKNKGFSDVAKGLESD